MLMNLRPEIQVFTVAWSDDPVGKLPHLFFFFFFTEAIYYSVTAKQKTPLPSRNSKHHTRDTFLGCSPGQTPRPNRVIGTHKRHHNK
jgi:hypothetical protein